MKKLIIAAAALMVSLVSYGQGSFVFNNHAGTDINAKIVLPDGTTGLSGTDYTWQLLASSGTDLASATPLISGNFRTGNGAGLVSAPSEAVVVPGLKGGTTANVWLSIYQGATVSGTPLTTFGPWSVALAEAPNPPQYLPMGTSPLVVVPEPTTLALGALGIGALLFMRRRS